LRKWPIVQSAIDRYLCRMAVTAKIRRRWFGALCLLAAVGMLVGGETTPGSQLTGLAFVTYWLVCLVFAALAMFTAILDVRALRREARDEQRTLLENTLEAIQTETNPSPSRRSEANRENSRKNNRKVN
jgi:hypothetical protein